MFAGLRLLVACLRLAEPIPGRVHALISRARWAARH